MRPGSARAHGADVYDPLGRPRTGLDFSSTVASLAPPKGWKPRAAAALDRLGLYPQPRSGALAAWLERRLGLPEGAVLVGQGSSECLEWLARAAGGERCLVEGPFFGEYLPLLQSAGALPSALFSAAAPQRPDLASQLRGVAGGWAWIADPANPSGLCLDPEGLASLLAEARRRRVRLVIDQALEAQCLEARPDLAAVAAARPGVFLVRSLSKALGLPGLRLGYVVGHPSSLAALLPFTRPWSVNSLAQALGPWLFDEERRQAPALRRGLAARKQDLMTRLHPLGLELQPSGTGYFLARLPRRGPPALAVSVALEARGLWIRPCHTYGRWGARSLRLNPREPRDNAALAKALAALLGR